MIERVAHDDTIVRVRSDPSRPVEFSVGSSTLPELKQKLARRTKHLDAIVSEVCDYHVTFAIDCNACWAVELALAVTKGTEGKYYLSFLVKNYDARVPAINDKQTLLAIHRHAVGLIKPFTLYRSFAELFNELSFFCEYL